MKIKKPFSGDVPFMLRVPGLRHDDVVAVQRGLARLDREEPSTIQRLWEIHVRRDPDYDEPDDGVIRKIGQDGQDHKLFLHYRPDLPRLLAGSGIRLKLWQCAWFAACGHIWRTCSAAMDELVREMDEMVQGFDFANRTASYRDQHVLRVVKYDLRPGGLANEHSDRSAITLRIAESHPGFYVRDGWNKRFVSAPATPEVDYFAGDQLERITKGGIRRTWHGVDDSTGGAEARYAVVFFGKMYPK